MTNNNRGWALPAKKEQMADKEVKTAVSGDISSAIEFGRKIQECAGFGGSKFFERVIPLKINILSFR
ncbi:MAG: hypothetical protein OHK0019_36870 [Saprospiraceae bacterium]